MKTVPVCFPFSGQNFLENHDGPRAAATFAPEVHQAAAVIIFCRRVLFFHAIYGRVEVLTRMEHTSGESEGNH